MNKVQQAPQDSTFTSSGEAQDVRDAYDKVENGGKK